MSEWSWIFIAVLAVVAVLAIVVGLWVSRRRRSARLKEQFGPEYDRTVGELGEQRAAEAELVAREKKHKKLDIIFLTPEARQEHAAMWAKVQTDFVEDPQDAVGRAERLVTRVMRERGYPIDDFDQRAADVSVDHPDVVENYRSAHAIYLSQHDGDISTEDARQAFVHYRALFERLLASDSDTDTEVKHGEQRSQSHDHA
jgi:FtsZ-interacting cell division protein ZipA